MKDAYYFPHDSNSQYDDKISMIRLEFGWAGYGLFFAIIEKLRDCPGYRWSSDAQAGLAASLTDAQTTLEYVTKVYARLLSLKLIIDDGKWIFSQSLIDRMIKIDERRQRLIESGRLGGIASSIAQASLKQPSSRKGK